MTSSYLSEQEPFWNPSVWSWNFDFYKEVVKILFHSYSAKVKQDETARDMLPIWWQDILDWIDEETWKTFTGYDKQVSLHWANEVVNLVKRWPEERGALRATFARMAFAIDYVIYEAHGVVSPLHLCYLFGY